jgi:hypothetical protein
MTSKYLSTILIAALSFALCMPAEAQKRNITQSSDKPIGGVTTGDVVAAVVVAAALVAVVAFVVIHESTKKRTITGCITSGASGLTLSDEKDGRVYALSGDTAGLTPGDRMRLRGRKVKSKRPDKTLVWNATRVAQDFGACQP